MAESGREIDAGLRNAVSFLEIHRATRDRCHTRRVRTSALRLLHDCIISTRLYRMASADRCHGGIENPIPELEPIAHRLRPAGTIPGRRPGSVGCFSYSPEQAQVASMKVQHAEREIIAKHGRTIAEQAAMILAAAQPPRPCPK